VKFWRVSRCHPAWASLGSSPMVAIASSAAEARVEK
jgi:hypothetical protein